MLPSRYRARITWLCGVNSLAFVTEDGVSESQVANAAQLFNNYGPKANEEFLMGYGFSMEDNPQVGGVLGSACHLRPTQPFFRAGLGRDQSFLWRRPTSYVEADNTGLGRAGAEALPSAKPRPTRQVDVATPCKPCWHTRLTVC